MCGTAPWEWDPKQGGKLRAYEGVEVFCQGCYIKASMRQLDGGRNTDGVTFELVPNDGGMDSARRQLKRKRMARG